MKRFVGWVLLFVVVFYGTSTLYHFYLLSNPRKTAIVIDSSYEMKISLAKIPSIIQDMNEERYTVFSLMTEKALLHDWSPQITLQNIVAYGPRNLDAIIDQNWNQLKEADKKVFITYTSDDTSQLTDWTILKL